MLPNKIKKCNFSAEGAAKVAELERLLLTTYSPVLIKEYVHKLMGKVPERQLMFLTDKVCQRAIVLECVPNIAM